MRPEDRDLSYLLDMMIHARAVVFSTNDKSLDDYLCDEDMRLALERRIEIIGEAASHVSKPFRTLHSEFHGRGLLRKETFWLMSTGNWTTR